jgi:hypothetical protein
MGAANEAKTSMHPSADKSGNTSSSLSCLRTSHDARINENVLENLPTVSPSCLARLPNRISQMTLEPKTSRLARAFRPASEPTALFAYPEGRPVRERAHSSMNT